ncbi:MAG: chloride channel protein [Bdellovibrio sp.]|nr:chloride channel protein [Bdellovibrio sp.]
MITQLKNQETVKYLQEKLITNIPFWVAAALAAVISVFYNYLFKFCEDWALKHASSPWLLLTAPLALLASFLMGHFLSKEALGSGIPQVMAAMELSTTNNKFLDKLLSVPMLLVKIFGSCICVLGGGVSGREGPTLQVSAAIFYQMTKYWPKKLPAPQLPAMMLAGGAAGLASAFNTPLGGIVFAIEELAKTHISLVRTAVFQAVIIAGIMSQFFLGNYLYFGNSSFDAITARVIFQTIFIAVVIGAISGLFAEGLYRVGKWRAQKTFSEKIFITLFFGLLLSLTIWLCGPSTIGAGKSVILSSLQNPDQTLAAEVPASRILGNFFTYSAGVIGGVFAPALASGATLAHWLSQNLGFSNFKLMAFVGMVAFLTGVTRSPFTSFVLVLEMGDSHEIILYLMLASMIANVAARLVAKKSFYEQVCHDLIKKVEESSSPRA